MAELFRMPKLGMDMEEGIVVRWLKAEGDTVDKGEALAEIETDKSSVEVESPASGTVLKLYCGEDEALPCGTPIACIGAPGEAIPEPTATEAAPAATSVAAPAVAATTDGIFYMPKLGMDMEEGIITRWLKTEGDTVTKGEALAEIETDKSSVEVESPATGIVRKLYYAEEEALPCGTPIAFIGGANDPIPDPASLTAATAAPAAQEAATAPAVDTSIFFCMPKLGMDMEEGIVATWLKAEGDTVEKGEALAEIETDKSVVTAESNLSGVVLKIYYLEGEAVPCGEPIAAIGPAGTVAPEKPVMAAQPTEAPATPAAPAAPVQVARTEAKTGGVAARTPGGRIKASPRARRLAAEKGVELSNLQGTGMDDRIIEQDVLTYLETAANAPAAAVRVPEETIVPLTGVRKVTARRMRQSLQNAAQTNHRVDVDVTNLMAFRKQVNARLEKDGIKVSIVDILAMSCAKALMENPMANAYLMDDGLHMHNYANIGIACDTPKGLMVPVIKDVDILSLPQLSKASKAIINKARNGELKPDDMSGGTFTISNLGMYEIDSFTAVLNPPETCILAVGRIADRVVAENGQMVIRPMMNLCLTYDHQVLDGAPAAQFLQTIKHYIENPVWLML
ncbi:MAG: 2-oxo acid dehydrogenase subunit E2 [Oscillospiraceae bacterium]|nr:2-oxo acid dehydrogenase subunit E2 [Oscillospiraceae bacterium]